MFDKKEEGVSQFKLKLFDDLKEWSEAFAGSDERIFDAYVMGSGKVKTPVEIVVSRFNMRITNLENAMIYDEVCPVIEIAELKDWSIVYEWIDTNFGGDISKIFQITQETKAEFCKGFPTIESRISFWYQDAHNIYSPYSLDRLPPLSRKLTSWHNVYLARMIVNGQFNDICFVSGGIPELCGDDVIKFITKYLINAYDFWECKLDESGDSLTIKLLNMWEFVVDFKGVFDTK